MTAGVSIMVKMQLRYIVEDVDRHGNVRVYFRRPNWPKVRMTGPIGSAEFLSEYNKLVALETPPQQPASGPARSKVGTLRWLIECYFAAPEFRLELAPRTQYVRRNLLEHCCQERIAPGVPEMFADMPVNRISPKSIRVLRDRKAATPGAANERLKAMRQLLKWALETGMSGLAANHALLVPYMRTDGDGWHSWTVDEVEQYEARHPIGTKARMALDLLLYTGVRRSDVILLGRQHVRDHVLRFTATKGRRRNPVHMELPVLPVLELSISATTERGDLTFLITKWGKPHSHGGFGNWFRRRCEEAGLPANCSAHGLRKAGAVRAAENGATANELMAIFGWATIREAERYTKAADRRRLARGGMAHLSRPERTGT